jgi:hypothetical protein
MIRRLRGRLAKPLPAYFVPVLLLGITALAYGLLFLWQGFYWDDYPISWIAHTFGNGGLARYFSTNRPLWGLLYQASNSLLGDVPWRWQLFGLFWRWLSAVLLWLVARRVWPKHPFAAALAGLAALVYPGFGQQLIGRVYGHFFLVLCAFFFSLYASLRALECKRGWIFWLVSALLASLVNLVTLEYFFLLELVRPVLFAFTPVIADSKGRERILRALKAWLPYLGLFLAAGVWRFFLFPYQTNNYQAVALELIRTQPLRGLLQLAWTWLSQTFTAGISAWVKAFTLPDVGSLGALNFGLYLLALIGGLAVVLFMLMRSPVDRDLHTRDGLSMAACGGIALAVAGWPFFLTGLPVALGFPNDRFALPFILGSSLVVAGLLLAVPGKTVWRVGLAALLIAPAVGYHFLNATQYRRDWSLQKSFFWQLSWRAPGLAEGTTLLTNDLPAKYFSDNSLTAPLNWIYAPDNRSQEMSYMLFYPSVRLGRPELPALQTGLPIHVDFLAATFDGSTSQTVVLNFTPPGCLRVIDGQLELDNLFVEGSLRDVAASLGSTGWILPDPAQPALLPPELYGVEPAHGWCYYFEKADLARQQGDWQQVAALGDQAFALGDYPNDPAERIPFIEGYAHVGQWQRAAELTRQSADISPVIHATLCRLWQRIDQSTPASSEKDQVLPAVQVELECSSG